MFQVDDVTTSAGISSARTDGVAARFRAAFAGERVPFPMPRSHQAGLLPVVTFESVVHEFPGVDHLVAAVAHGLRRLAPGGSLVLTDVRSLPMLPVAHTAAVLGRAAAGDRAGVTVERLAERIRDGIATEPDLAVDPRLFDALAVCFPGITEVRVTPRPGPDGPATRFRYDVTLTVAGGLPLAAPPGEPSGQTPDWADWDAAGLTRAEVEAEFAEREAEVLAARDVPNARVERFAQALHRIGTDPGTPLDELLALVAAPAEDELDPRELRALARMHGYHVAVDFSRHDADGRFDLLAWRDDVPPPARWRRPGDATGLTELPDRADRSGVAGRPARAGSGRPHGLDDLANVPHRPVTGV